jgi:hypothetical protein
MDKARPHNSGRAQRCIEASRAKRLPHLAYSPDLTPTDFFFGHIKFKLSDYNCEIREDVLVAITEIFTGRPGSTPKRLRILTELIKVGDQAREEILY